MQLLLVVADAGLHQQLRDLVLQLDVLPDQQLPVAQGASALPDLHRCHVALRQEVTAQAVGDPACIDAIVLLLRHGNGTQHQRMSHLHRCRVRSKVVVDPARKHGRFHRHRPGLRQRPNPLPQALPRRRNLALRQHLATDVLHAITDRLLVDVQPDEVHTGHEEPPWMSLNQPLLLSSALVHQVLLSPTTYPYKQVISTN